MRDKLIIPVLLLAALVGCKPQAQPEQSPAAPENGGAGRLLDAAIDSRGGLANLKATSSWVGKWKGTSGGATHEGSMIYRNGEVRRDFSAPDGKKVSVVRALRQCWTTMGDSLIPCTEEEKQLTRKGIAMNRASALWPLKEQGWELQAGQERLGEKTFDVLKAKSVEFEAEVKLYLDPQSHLASRVVVGGITLKGETGELIAEIQGTQQACNATLYSKSAVSFGRQLLSINENSDIECGPVEDKVFEQPATQGAPPANEKLPPEDRGNLE